MLHQSGPLHHNTPNQSFIIVLLSSFLVYIDGGSVGDVYVSVWTYGCFIREGNDPGSEACGGGVALKTTGSTAVVWIRDPGGQHRLFNIFKWLCYKGNIRVYDLIR